jgi:NAD dependent epimerase/dehydratase family enzyme
MSWIHIEDLAALISYVVTEKTLRGVLNATSPQSVTNAEFAAALGETLHRPAIIPVPPFVLRKMLGEMAEMVLSSQRVVPEATINSGFIFEFPDVLGALFEILRK